MFLEGGTRNHFTKWLASERPDLAAGYDRLYARKYAPAAYRKEVHAVFNSLRDKYGLNHRERRDETEPEPIQLAEQQMLRWRE